MKRQQGFTIIELIVVIVVLGILAATAIPRFANIAVEARIASMQGVAGSMLAAKEVVRGKWYAVGSANQATVTAADNTSIAVQTVAGGAAQADAGFPTGAGMASALSVGGGISCTSNATSATCTPTGFSSCSVVYTAIGAIVDTSALTSGNCGG